MIDCRCYIEHGDGDIEEIIQCPLCAAAPNMLKALKFTQVALANWRDVVDETIEQAEKQVV